MVQVLRMIIFAAGALLIILAVVALGIGSIWLMFDDEKRRKNDDNV